MDEPFDWLAHLRRVAEENERRAKQYPAGSTIRLQYEVFARSARALLPKESDATDGRSDLPAVR